MDYEHEDSPAQVPEIAPALPSRMRAPELTTLAIIVQS
jgi:hypothetical protein